ncbi:DUF1934 domain-containing protein [Streptococcus oricebi]|uniref:DUF1934 domain-containing protein n=1 Tax=Streptococcus oricebi TaxID=1547447 RepID=A0ABS5B132_9STRE|nr:DUF1934 domain-containing protein [Streptococcus oricebi]MBP2622539.1 DUF1934 domain-containing protein [Streptococcus oricebi]
MKLRIKNQIDLGGQVEEIDYICPAQYHQKGDQTYLTYENEDKERVVLKFDAQGLSMTRYSQPKSVMRFLKNEAVQVAIPTPLGYQNLLTQTQVYDLDLEKQRLILHYQLLNPSQEQVFAYYKLQISWS